MIDIGIPEITSHKEKIYYKTKITLNDEIKYLWFSIQKDFSDFISESSDAALAALLIPAMQRGENIRVRGFISEKMHLNFSEPLQKVLMNVIPCLEKVEIYAEDKRKVFYNSKGVATGFSGGIDSFCTLYDRFYNLDKSPYKITHLLFNNVGSHGKNESSREIFENRYKNLLKFTQRIGLPFLKIDSNLGEFYDNKTNFKQTHTIRNVSVALLLQKKISQFLYSSGIHLSDSFVGPSSAMAFSDIASLPLMGTESIEPISFGGHYSRVEKTIKVSSIIDSYNSLDVCSKGETPNCSYCKKCMRTLLTLELSGNLEKYSDVFYLDIYQREKRKYIAKTISKNDLFFKEIAEYMGNRKMKDFNFSKIHLFYYKLKNLLKI